MWIISFFIFGPFIYLIVSIIADSVSYKINKIKRKKYYGEEEIAFFSTYKNDNISKEDIMHLFVAQFKKYRQHYFSIEYRVFRNKEEQNYAWSIKTTKQTFGWGIIYNILFNFSNGWVYLSFSNDEFFFGEKISLEYYLNGLDFGTLSIESILNTCRDEARTTWKINGIESKKDLPFNYISLLSNNRSSQKNTTQFDSLSFYRNLLGLKLCFSQIELKNAYRKAVAKYHPDRYGSSSSRDRENAETLMKQVNEAYENLKKTTT